MSPRDAASARQVEAADPAACTWLSANAGSGKTRVLTDRVARLLLRGVAPQRILCLTYTKAAASEMQNRLFDRLGEWAMLEEKALRDQLSALGVEERLDADILARARRLFARAIETPGGLKVQTIHSFCAALLRRFPLEAGVSPQFSEMDERSARLLREEILEELAEHEPAVVDPLMRHLGGEDIERLLGEIAGNRDALRRPLDRAQALAMFDLPEGYDAPALVDEALDRDDAALIGRLVTQLATASPTDIKAAAKLSAFRDQAPGPGAIALLEEVLLTGASAKAPFSAKIGRFPTKATRGQMDPADCDALDALMERVEAARPRRLGLAAADKTLALHGFAARFLEILEAHKAARGWLDFDDLIARAVTLLRESSVAQWVLFKLDGGVDHILVDEAQDTSPDQWQVIESLTQEFTAGLGAREAERTIFVVGDKKQSIYSFQGADLRVFDATRERYEAALSRAGIGLETLALEHSFRSAHAILRLVDLTFDTGAGRGLGGAVRHIAFHPDMPGRVDLWPALEKSEKPAERDWWDPVDIVPEEHETARLARAIADEIARLLRERTVIPEPGRAPRALGAGDVLILLRRRSALFHRIIAACKAAGLPVAGVDRMQLGGELAVRDLTALLAFLATPEDDLSLASALRSPLFGWSEDALYSLAHDRGGAYLWTALRNDAGAEETRAILTDLRDQADFLRPFELIERMLTRHDGRRRLLARLGPEAEEGIDALLAQALAYETREVPSLTGFLGWLGSAEVEIKRQLDSGNDAIRVMTVHGAKGLEAPLVILPDTAARDAPRGGALCPMPGGAVAWRTAAGEQPPAMAKALEAARAAGAEEEMRLLYVAMTRAQSWLIVAAAGDVGGGDAWYDRVAQGLDAAGAGVAHFPTGKGLRLEEGGWPAAAPDAPTGAAEADDPIPAYATRPAPPPPATAAFLSPSDLGGAKALPGEGALRDEAAATLRGSRLHLLLEHLPAWPESAWPAIARNLLAAGEEGAPADAAEEESLIAEARNVLRAPDLRFLFGPDTLAEVGITADYQGQRLLGVIDRLVIGAEGVLAVDFKSNAVVPEEPGAVPEGLLRQMAAYEAALRQVYPDRTVEVALLWTRRALLMPLPPALLHSCHAPPGA